MEAMYLKDLELEDSFAVLKPLMDSSADVTKMSIIVVATNVLVATQEGVYYPNEIGLTKFSVNDGIQSTYTKLIACQTPNGYYSVAKEHSERTHKLELNVKSGNKEYEFDFNRLFDEIYAFMAESQLKDTNEKPMIFCRPPAQNLDSSDERPQVIRCLEFIDFMATKRGLKSLFDDFVVINVTDLLYAMVRKYCVVFRPLSLLADDLSLCKYDYNPHMSCRYHTELDNIYCANAMALRMSYLFLDSLLSLKLKPEVAVTLKDSHKAPALQFECIAYEKAFTSADNRKGKPYHFNPDNPLPYDAMRPKATATANSPNLTGLGRGRVPK